MTALQERLFSMRDEAYREFSARLVPNVPAESVVGVRVPEIRRLSGEMGEGERAAFMAGLPHEFHEENLLHAFCVERVRGFGQCVAEVERFLPFATNWAVTDSCNPRALASDPDALLGRVRAWLGSDWPYTVRFALLSLMRHFLDARFSPAVLGLAASVRPEDYYVRMMQAWFFATALAKRWDEALPFVGEGGEGAPLCGWVRAKAVQKAVESRRIPDGRKEILRSLRGRA